MIHCLCVDDTLRISYVVQWVRAANISSVLHDDLLLYSFSRERVTCSYKDKGYTPTMGISNTEFVYWPVHVTLACVYEYIAVFDDRTRVRSTNCNSTN